MTILLEAAGAALILLGMLVLTASVVATLRGHDLYLRLHSAGKSVVLGVLPVLAGSVGTGDAALIARAFLVAVFLLPTAAVSAHAIAFAAHRRGEEEESEEEAPQSGGGGESRPAR